MTSAADPYPSDEEIRRANEGLIAIVRDRLPMGFYRQADQWSKWSTAALVRMADTVEAAMSLMEAGLEVDARTLLRSLYEQVVTFAWLGIDPGPRFSRWFGDGLLEDLRLHNDAQPFGIMILEEDELADTKRLLKLRDEDEAPREPDCTGKHKRTSNKPDAALVLPPVPSARSRLTSTGRRASRVCTNIVIRSASLGSTCSASALPVDLCIQR